MNLTFNIMSDKCGHEYHKGHRLHIWHQLLDQAFERPNDLVVTEDLIEIDKEEARQILHRETLIRQREPELI